MIANHIIHTLNTPLGVPSVKDPWVCPKCQQQVIGSKCVNCEISYFIAQHSNLGYVKVFFHAPYITGKVGRQVYISGKFFSVQTIDGKKIDVQHVNFVYAKDIVSFFPNSLPFCIN